MTYCVGLWLKEGMGFLSDTRTNAGVDNISIFSKMHLFQIPGERFITLLTGGNLAIAQAVVNLLHEGIKTEESDKKVSENYVSDHLRVGIDALKQLINNGLTVKHLRF